MLWDAWRAMQSVTAWHRMSLTKAFAMAQPTSAEQAANRARVFEAEMALAFPPEEGADGHT